MKVGLVAVPNVDVGTDGLEPTGADRQRPCPPYGVYLLAGVLRDSGHDVTIIDLIADGEANLDPGDLVDDLDLVGVSATSLSWAAALVCMEQIRLRRPDLFIVAGGVHASLFDDWVLRHSHANAVVRSDGEAALRELVEVLARGGDLALVPSLTWIGDDGELQRTTDAPPIEQAAIARWMPAYEQLPDRAYFGLAFESSRGCAFACSFCSTPHKGRWRGGDPTAVVDRLEQLVPFLDRTIAHAVYIVDDEFTMSPRRAREIAGLLSERQLPLRLLYDSRANDLLRPGLVEALAPHTHSLLVGAECGYDEGLARIGKGSTCATLVGAAARLQSAGIAGQADFSFILGLPWETANELRLTIDFAMSLAEDFGVRVLFNWYAQIPGSDLWAQARSRGAIHEGRYDSFGLLRDPDVFFGSMAVDEQEVIDAVAYARDRGAQLPAGVPRPQIALPAALARPWRREARIQLTSQRPIIL